MSPIRALLVIALLAVGTAFLTVGTVGLLRFPNVYNRLHATTKAATLGAASTLLAGTAYYGPRGAGLTSLVGIGFLFLTAPTGAHMISRAAHRMGVDFHGDAAWPAPDHREEGGDGEDAPDAAAGNPQDPDGG
ncbi:MAG: monovalent cation/H(+) antiporter subunit G [Halobacteriaceae archaeon]